MSTIERHREFARELRRLEAKRTQGPLSAEEAARRRTLIEHILQQSHLGQTADERRLHLRIPAELEAQLMVGDTRLTCSAAELSLGGLSLRGCLWVEPGQELLVQNLRVGRRDYPMAVAAKIAWKSKDGEHPAGAGLTFTEPEESSLKQIRSVYEQLFLLFLDRLISDD